MPIRTTKASKKERPMPFRPDIPIYDEAKGAWVTSKAQSSEKAPQPTVRDKDMTPFHKGYDEYQRRKAEKPSVSRKKPGLAVASQTKKSLSSGTRGMDKAKRVGKENRRLGGKIQGKIQKKAAGPGVDLGWFRQCKGVDKRSK